MNNFVNRRNKLLDLVKEDNSVIILFAGKLVRQSEDANYDFFVNRNFYYLTGISQENSCLVINKSNHKSILYIDEFDPKKEKWYGKKLTQDESKNISGVDEVRLLNSFDADLKSLLVANTNIYLDLDQVEAKTFSDSYKNSYKINNVYPLLADLRLIKDKDEINQIKEAIKITHLGLDQAIKVAKTAKNEFEIYNAFNHEVLNHGTHEIAFPSIIATGVHTCCLHYPTPFDKVARNGLLLCDVGAGYNHYSADVTRTYPLSGKFNDFQKVIYEIVLGCNKEVINSVKPGVKLSDLNELAKDYLANKCVEHKLINDKKDIEKYYFHKVSHPLGLNTHDIGGREFVLKEGMVITVEPGLYILEKETGVRIEDDVLVTSNGHEVLSSEIAKEIKDIEKLTK